MFHCLRLRSPLCLNAVSQLSPTPKCYRFLPSLISLNFFSATSASASDQQSFTVSYLTNTCGLSPQAALKASKRIRFVTAQKPDSVIAFFRNQGFSTSQIQTIIVRAPELFVCDPIKTVLPKFEFLASKGASASDIVIMVTRSPRFLRASLEKHVIPAFELVRGFCPSDKKAVACVIAYPTSISDARLERNVTFLLDAGVSPSNIHQFLRTRPSVLFYGDIRKVVEEVKGLGFDPSNIILV